MNGQIMNNERDYNVYSDADMKQIKNDISAIKASLTLLFNVLQHNFEITLKEQQ